MKCFLKLSFVASSILFLLVLSAPALAQDGKWYHWYPFPQGDFSRYGFGSSRAEVCAQLIGPAVATLPPADRERIVYEGMLPPPFQFDCGVQLQNGPFVVNFGLLPQFFATCAEINTWNAGNSTPEECLVPCPPDQREADGTCRFRSGKQGGTSCPSCGNPVNPATGNKFLVETDLAAEQAGGLSFTRVYNSGRPALTRSFGRRWQHNFSSRIIPDPSAGRATYYRNDGKQLVFALQPSSGQWLPDADVADRLVEVKAKPYRTAWKYHIAATDQVETFDAGGTLLSIENRAGLKTTLVYSDGTDGSVSRNGGFVLDALGNPTSTVLPARLLLRVSDPFGRTLVFGYNAASRIVKITDPAGGVLRYAYDTDHNLVSVTYQDATQRQYLYNEPAHTAGANLPYALTGVIDENGTRFAIYAYDANGRAVKTTHLAGGLEVNRHLLTYDVSGVQTTAVDPLGTSRAYAFQTSLGVDRNTGRTQPAASGNGTASETTSFDANGNVSSRLDWNTNRADHAYDLVRNLETRRTEALSASGTTTPQTRTISTQWHPAFRLPVIVAEPLRTTSFVYNGDASTSCGFKADGVTHVPSVPCSKTIQPTADANGSSSSTIGTFSMPVTWTKATIGTCHNVSCSPTFTDIAYVYGNDPAGACLAAQLLTVWPALLEPGGASGSGASGICHYRHTTNNTTHNQGTWEVVTGCVSGTYPNQVLTAPGSGNCVHTPPMGTVRTWTYTYNANGDVLTVKGPRTDVSDVTTYTYHANDHADLGKRGKVATIANAAGHTTNITAYNAHGQPLTIVDPNGLTTTMTYDARLRLRTRTVGTELTTYYYDDTGQLTKVTLPDGSFLSYTYDTAHRLTEIQDNLGNRISYSFDAMGNRTAEEVRDPANQLAQTRSRVFNSLNRLFRELGAQSQTTEYAYDDQGNTTSVKDPLNRITTNQYDALNRLRRVTSPTPISAVTQYAHNGLDTLTQVTDPRSLVTGYTVDGLGNLTQQSSPDTGSTASTHDAAGNLLTQTDAKRQITTYDYDALNRVTLITFHDGSKQAYVYDQGTNGIGRLSSITETSPPPANQVTSVIAYAYDQQGRVTSETRTIAGTQYLLGYRYDSAGRLDQLTYPSGRTVDYSFDGLGRVSGVTTTKPGSPAQTVVSNVAYHPFGGVKGYALGNGQIYTRGIDLDGRIASYTLGSESFAIGYDLTSRIEFISRFQPATPPNTNTYGYDNLDRLTSAMLPTTPYTYTYDAVGNRTSRTGDSSTDIYAYSSTSNRIASITPSSGPVRNFVFDPNGSSTADGNNTYVYDTRGRMVQATSSLGLTNYQVNALGQRIRKTNTLGDTVFHYDAGGRLIAETGPSGTLKRELIYLGEIPVGVVQ